MKAFIRVIAVALALASTTAWSSHPFESAGNQYRVREDGPQPLQLLNEATVYHPKVIEDSTPNPDLQVGCGEGHIHEKVRDTDKNSVHKDKSFGTGKSSFRRRRRATQWSGQVIYSSPYQSVRVWKPPVSQLNRPYFIPIFGIQGRQPIFYPPQPLQYNPGFPKDNPKQPFAGPTYLPPVEDTTMIKDRFGEDTDRPIFNGGDNMDDRPIWDMNNGQGTTKRPSTTFRPTRRTRRPGAPTRPTPPLIHGGGGGETGVKESPPMSNNNDQTIKESELPPPTAVSQQRPPQNARPNPSKCVWAIISCCSSAGEISYDCFDQRGCPGAFWDNSPCESDFAKAALSAALNYYE